MGDESTFDKLIFAGALTRSPAAVYLFQGALDQAVHQGTGGDFEAILTWGGGGGVQNNQKELRTVLIKNPEGNTCYDSIQVDVGEGFHAQ